MLTVCSVAFFGQCWHIT